MTTYPRANCNTTCHLATIKPCPWPLLPLTPKSPLVVPQTLLSMPYGLPTLATLSCQDNSIHDTLPVGPLLGATYCQTHILLFLRHSFPLLYVSSPLFCLRTPALPPLLALFYLSIGHGTTPLSLQPCTHHLENPYLLIHVNK